MAAENCQFLQAINVEGHGILDPSIPTRSGASVLDGDRRPTDTKPRHNHEGEETKDVSERGGRLA
jgi:hypothetical protein